MYRLSSTWRNVCVTICVTCIVLMVPSLVRAGNITWLRQCRKQGKGNHTLIFSLRWRHNGHAGVSNHQPRGCLLNRLFGRKSKKTSKLRVTGLCAGNSPGTGEFPAQMASYAENVSIWWRHHVNQYRLEAIDMLRHPRTSLTCNYSSIPIS